jgi:hypothetical protein
MQIVLSVIHSNSNLLLTILEEISVDGHEISVGDHDEQEMFEVIESVDTSIPKQGPILNSSIRSN